MSLELVLLNSFAASKEVYDKLDSIITEEDFSIKGRMVYDEIVDYYDKDSSADRVDYQVLKACLGRKYPKHVDVMEGIVDKFQDTISIPNACEEILEHKKNTIGTHLGGLLLNPKSKQHDKDHYMELYNQYSELSMADFDEDNETTIVGGSVMDLAETFSPKNLYKIFPSALNDILDGGVPLHTHIGLMGVPESGKTLFAINNAAGFARNGLRVLYVGVEDPPDAYRLRIVNRLTELTRAQILSDPLAADALAKERGWDNIIFTSLQHGTFPEIRGLIEKYQPTLVILDQIRQLVMKGVDGDVAQLTAATKAARKVTKDFPIITISLTQAGDSAENKPILEKGDVYMSNTTFPGDVDVLIGWGMNEAYEAANKRVLSLPKNKISGKHGHVHVSIDPHLSKVIS
mgnify:FL=1